jgi:hypothetical protein
MPANTLSKTTHYLHLLPDGALPDLQLPPFLAIVLVEDEVSESWMWDACRWLVASGCRVMLAWGRDAQAWREAVDDAALEAVDYEDAPDERSVVATAHEADDEDIDDVFWFARHRAAHPALPLTAALILHIAPAARQDELEARYADA